MLLTPDKKPFFAGTYLSKESRFGRIGLIELIARGKKYQVADLEGPLWNF